MERSIINSNAGEYTVTGQITHKESQFGIPNLTVSIYDLEEEVNTISNPSE